MIRFFEKKGYYVSLNCRLHTSFYLACGGNTVEDSADLEVHLVTHPHEVPGFVLGQVGKHHLHLLAADGVNEVAACIVKSHSFVTQ